MNRAVPDQIIDEIRSRCDIVELVNSYLPLKRAGGSRWKACCPFHEEKTPSFTVDSQRQRYHCFGCGKGGDVFSFVMEKEGVDFPNSAHLLASRLGIIIPEETYDSPQERAQAKARANKRERIYAINDAFAKWFAGTLNNYPDSPVAVYLRSRQIPPDIAAKFELGAAPDSWDAGLQYGRSLGFSDNELLDAGIVLKNENSGRVYDRFRNRLVFPIWNEQGRVVAFSARTIEQEVQGAKYVNSPETPVFRKSNVLYALPKARQGIQQRKSVILCEGQLDVIAMHRAGFDNSVAPQGTAFTDEQARILKRYSDLIYIAFDSDGAGRKAALRAFELVLPLDFEAKVIIFPGGEDPDGIFRAQGEQGISALVENAVDFFDFLFEQTAVQHDTASPVGKGRVVSEIIPYLQKITNSVTRELYMTRLAEVLNIRIETIFKEMNKFRSQARYGRQDYDFEPQHQEPQKTAATVVAVPALIAQAEETLLRLALLDENTGTRLGSQLPHEMISESPVGKALNEAIRLTMSGEWESCIEHLTESERDNPDRKLSEILLEADPGLKKSKLEQAVRECVDAIKVHHRKIKTAELMEQLKNASTAEEKKQCLTKLQELSNATK